NDKDGDLKDVADGAVQVEPEIGNHALGRDIPGLEITRQMRADINVDRDAGDHADEAPAVGPPARFRNQRDQKNADDECIERQESRVERQVLVTQRDVTTKYKRSNDRGPVENIA